MQASDHCSMTSKSRAICHDNADSPFVKVRILDVHMLMLTNDWQFKSSMRRIAGALWDFSCTSVFNA